MWWHVGILLSKMPTLCWVWSGGGFHSSVCPSQFIQGAEIGFLFKPCHLKTVNCMQKYIHSFMASIWFVFWASPFAREDDIGPEE